MPKDTLTFNGLTLTAGSPSSAGKARYFGESPEHKTKVELNGKIYTVYNTVSLYEEGSVPKNIEPKVEAFDSAQRKVKKGGTTETPKSSDGGTNEVKLSAVQLEVMALAAKLGLKLA